MRGALEFARLKAQAAKLPPAALSESTRRVGDRTGDASEGRSNITIPLHWRSLAIATPPRTKSSKALPTHHDTHQHVDGSALPPVADQALPPVVEQQQQRVVYGSPWDTDDERVGTQAGGDQKSAEAAVASLPSLTGRGGRVGSRDKPSGQMVVPPNSKPNSRDGRGGK